MLDFTDFNSQHAIRILKELFSRLRTFLDPVTHGILQWCIDSFDNMWLLVNEELEDKFTDAQTKIIKG